MKIEYDKVLVNKHTLDFIEAVLRDAGKVNTANMLSKLVMEGLANLPLYVYSEKEVIDIEFKAEMDKIK